jgi:hypothetical protein
MQRGAVWRVIAGSNRMPASPVARSPERRNRRLLDRLGGFIDPLTFPGLGHLAWQPGSSEGYSSGCGGLSAIAEAGAMAAR